MSPGRTSAEPSGAERPKAAAVTRHMSSRVAGASGDTSAGQPAVFLRVGELDAGPVRAVRAGGGGRHAGGHGHGLRHGDALLGAERAVLKALYHAGGGHLHDRLIVPRAGGHVRERRGGILRGGGQGEGENCGQGSASFFIRCAPSWRGRCRAWRPAPRRRRACRRASCPCRGRARPSRGCP